MTLVEKPLNSSNQEYTYIDMTVMLAAARLNVRNIQGGPKN